MRSVPRCCIASKERCTSFQRLGPATYHATGTRRGRVRPSRQFIYPSIFIQAVQPRTSRA